MLSYDYFLHYGLKKENSKYNFYQKLITKYININ